MKAIIYCRVSTDDQVKFGHSLDSQKRICKDYADRNGYEVIRVFTEEGESAKTADRTQLNSLLHFASQKSSEINAVIFYKIDRFARNTEDYLSLRLLLSKYGIVLRSATENINDTPTGKFTENILAAVAQLDNEVRADRTKTGMKQAILAGRWCWRPHIGYKHEKDESQKPLLVPSEDAPFIKEAFALAESGLYKQINIVKELRRKGFKKLNEKRLNSVLRNPIYSGIIKVDWFPTPIEAIHEPLVSKTTFSKVQLLLDGKRAQITPRQRNHPLFPLRNFIRCPKCTQKLTGGLSTGRKGIKYPYYHCRTKGCSLNLKKQELEVNFYEYLKTFHPTEETLNLFEAVILDTWKTHQSEQIKNELRLEKELKTLQERKDRLDELVIKGTFNEVTYKQQIKKLEADVLTKEIELNETRSELKDIETYLNYCKYFLSHFADLWVQADVDLKQRFQSLIFPDKIYYENKTFRTTATTCIFKQLQGKSPDLSSLVAPTGFSWNQILSDIENIFKFRDLVPMPAPAGPHVQE